MTVSPLMLRLEAQMAACSAPHQRLAADCFRAERACLLSRQGQLAEARQALSGLQAEYANRPNAAMSAWLSLGEGLHAYFTNMDPASHDRIRRAHALSGAAAGEQRLHALCAAWLAQMDYVRGDFAGMAQHAGEALRLATTAEHGVLARACLVVAQAYHWAGHFARAQPWYARARQHGNADGDEATLSALMHNMAWLHADQARQPVLYAAVAADSAPGPADPAMGHGMTPQGLLMGADSTDNFDRQTGCAVLESMVPILKARILALQGQWAAALALYEAHVTPAMDQGLRRMQAHLRADMGWCRLQLGQERRALEDARVAALLVDDEVDLDDRAATHSRLTALLGRAGHAEAAARHAECALQCWDAHRSEQGQATLLLDQALGPATQ